jgi:hypothetical protein
MNEMGTIQHMYHFLKKGLRWEIDIGFPFLYLVFSHIDT